MISYCGRANGSLCFIRLDIIDVATKDDIVWICYVHQYGNFTTYHSQRTTQIKNDFCSRSHFTSIRAHLRHWNKVPFSRCFHMGVDTKTRHVLQVGTQWYRFLLALTMHGHSSVEAFGSWTSTTQLNKRTRQSWMSFMGRRFSCHGFSRCDTSARSYSAATIWYFTESNRGALMFLGVAGDA